MADAPPSFSTSTRSIAASGIAARFTPSAAVTPPAKVPSRLPLTSTSVELPPRPRNEAVWLLKVAAPMMLGSETFPRLLFAEIRFMSSIAFVLPLRKMSSRLITCTGSAPSPSTRLMFEPVTSTLMSAACAVCSSSANKLLIAAATSIRCCVFRAAFMR